MHLERQKVAHLVEAELSGTLDEHKLIAQLLKHMTADECVGSAEHIMLHREIIGTSRQFFTDSYHFLDATRSSHLCHP